MNPLPYLISRPSGMMHLITIAGKSARDFYLRQQQISDFKSLMRTITSGRTMIVSTWFRSDLFYQAEQSAHDALLKGWALHADADLSNLKPEDVQHLEGDESSLSEYFQSINLLAVNWYRYKLYRKAFHYSFSNDPQNPVAQMVVDCDQFLTAHPKIKRAPLVKSIEKKDTDLSGDTFSLAKRIINNQTHSN